MSGILDIQIEGFEELFQDLGGLVIKEDRGKVLKGLLNKIWSLNKKRLQAQKNLDGSSFAPRKDGSSAPTLVNVWRMTRYKPWKRSYRRDNATVISNNPIHEEHHYGAFKFERVNYRPKPTREKLRFLRQNWARKKFKKRIKRRERKKTEERFNLPTPGDGPWPWQIKRLREIGFTKSPWKTNPNFDAGTASFILLEHSVRRGIGGFRKPPRTRVLARHVLGLSRSDSPRLARRFRQLIAKFARKGRGKAGKAWRKNYVKNGPAIKRSWLSRRFTGSLHARE